MRGRLILMAIAFLFVPAAHASSPYAVKLGVMAGPDGQLVLKEKLYGHGVLSSGPVTFQLRNRDGALLANSPVSDHVAVVCPSVKFCWAFPDGAYLPFSAGWSLDAKVVEFGRPAPDYFFQDTEQEEFTAYMNDRRAGIISGYYLGYPEYDRSHSGFRKSGISVIFSPFLIIADQFLELGAAMILTFMPFAVYAAARTLAPSRPGVARLALRTMGIVSCILYMFFYCVAMLLLWFISLVPLFYMLCAIAVGVVSGKAFLKKSRDAARKEA